MHDSILYGTGRAIPLRVRDKIAPRLGDYVMFNDSYVGKRPDAATADQMNKYKGTVAVVTELEGTGGSDLGQADPADPNDAGKVIRWVRAQPLNSSSHAASREWQARGSNFVPQKMAKYSRSGEDQMKRRFAPIAKKLTKAELEEHLQLAAGGAAR